LILQAPAYIRANNVKRNSRTQNFTKTWSLALLFIFANIAVHLLLWYFSNWQAIALI